MFQKDNIELFFFFSLLTLPVTGGIEKTRLWLIICSIDFCPRRRGCCRRFVFLCLENVPTRTHGYYCVYTLCV